MEAPEEPASDGAALSEAATAAASDEEPDQDSAADEEPGDEPEAAAETEDEPAREKKAPPSSGEAHQPKTGVDIDESGSLFDL